MVPRTLTLCMLSEEQAERAATFLQEMIQKGYRMTVATQAGRVTNDEGKRVPGLGLYIQFEKGHIDFEKFINDCTKHLRTFGELSDKDIRAIYEKCL